MVARNTDGVKGKTLDPNFVLANSAVLSEPQSNV